MLMKRETNCDEQRLIKEHDRDRGCRKEVMTAADEKWWQWQTMGGNGCR
jgi:hypothetical protein